VTYCGRRDSDGTRLLFGLPLALVAVPAALSATGTTGNVNVLYGIEARDPGVLTVAVLVLIGSTVVAAVIPARRAASIDPTRALRSD
jgi:ABC-type lipoprotein release transport system permease subunit